MIKSFEACRLEAYQDSGGVWTIGWGHARQVRRGDICTAAQAESWFLEDIGGTELIVLNCLPDVELNDNQLSALVSFVYNVGLGYKGIKDGFLSLVSGKPSTLLACLRARDFAGAAAEFPKWCKIRGTPSDGLLRRRVAEQALFLKPE